MTFFRIQSAALDPADLLDPGHQYSRPVNGGSTKRGVSVCDSIEDLALYLASPIGCGVFTRLANRGGMVIVECDGPLSGDAPLDPEFESLILPVRIVAVTPVDEEFMAAIAAADEFLSSFSTGLED